MKVTVLLTLLLLSFNASAVSLQITSSSTFADKSIYITSSSTFADDEVCVSDSISDEEVVAIYAALN